MLETQLKLEMQYSDRNVNSIFEAYKEHLITEPLLVVEAYKQTEFNPVERPDLVDVMNELELKKDRIADILFSMVTFVLTKDSITLQALVGTVFNAFECATFRRRTILIEVLLKAVTKCKFITTERRGNYLYFESKLPLNDAINSQLDVQGFVLPSLTVPKVRDNKSIGYNTFKEHVISGGKLKEHNFDVALDHLNRVNSTAYCYETRLDIIVKPKFDKKRKLKDTGNYETDDDIKIRELSFNQLFDELPAKKNIMLEHGNRFHLAHKYDNRIRTYVKSTHFNYQGTKFLKSMIHFADKEVTSGEW